MRAQRRQSIPTTWMPCGMPPRHHMPRRQHQPSNFKLLLQDLAPALIHTPLLWLAPLALLTAAVQIPHCLQLHCRRMRCTLLPKDYNHMHRPSQTQLPSYFCLLPKAFHVTIAHSILPSLMLHTEYVMRHETRLLRRQIVSHRSSRHRMLSSQDSDCIRARQI